MLAKTSPEAAGQHCTAGGVKLEMGADANRNGTLDTSEVNSSLTQYVCNGTQGPACSSGWASTGSMTTARHWHTATLLPNCKVLVTGGLNNNSETAEVYNFCSGAWAPTGAMALPRAGHTATLLPNGKVLVAAGYGNANLPAAAEVYDPATGTWSTINSMLSPRYDHTATLLPNGKVLVAGGRDESGLATAEVYDPATGAWSATGSMASARFGHTATLLPNGKVLVAGGTQANLSPTFLATAEVYDPATGAWSATGSMTSPRKGHTATLLPNGKVLVAGGQTAWSGNIYVATAEVYDPALGTWSGVGSMASSRYEHTATLLPNGKVLVVGGYDGPMDATAEVYDFFMGTWSTAGSMTSPRYEHTATLLPNGKVLVVGGETEARDGTFFTTATAETYAP